ncbi:heme-binding protein soul2 [Erpetoichthys calabaricus]|uniref:Heme-binding protein 1-like n=1 Tax=Erpetoichthys calabaricus TaxID=27687 RepID=A0A8C4T7H4_ERPCA|nr:heme-binding protein soul2 [Erpetoichthys calabaricus]
MHSRIPVLFIFLHGVQLLLSAPVQNSAESGEPWFCRELECPAYVVVKSYENFEERRYEASCWMTTELEGSYTRAVYLGFMRLFWYINGNNAAGEKIPMTTPVITRVAPTTDQKHLTNVSVAFFVSPQVADPPKPNDESIHLSSFPAGNFYVRSFGGYAVEQDYIKNIKALMEDLKVAGLPFDNQHYIIAGYDPPFRFINRHNEVWLSSA